MYPLPSPGSESTITQKASVWRDIFTMLSQWRRGELTRRPPQSRRGTIWIKNNTGRDVEPGEFLQVTAMTQPADTSLGMATNYSPILTAEEPTWHTAIDNVVISDGPILEDELFAYQPRSFGIVQCTGQKGSGDRYVMIDPANPQYGITGSSGMFKVLGYDASNDVAIIDFGKSQPLWRYFTTEATQTPSDTTAKLHTLGNIEFSASTIELSDPYGITTHQPTARGGYCMQLGNKFYVTIPDPTENQHVTDFLIGSSSITIERKNIIAFGSEDITDEVNTGETCP